MLVLGMVVGAAFIVVALVVTVRRLVHSQPQSKTRKAMWGNLGQLGATAIFLVLAALAAHSASGLLRWGPIVAALLTALNVVVTLAVSRNQAPTT